jgi:hypothetical protein
MTLRVDLRLPSLSLETRRHLETTLKHLIASNGDVWVVSILESGREDEWLVLVTGGTEKPSLPPEWTFVAVEESGKSELICTYARTLSPAERAADLIADSLDDFLQAGKPRVTALRRAGGG